MAAWPLTGREEELREIAAALAAPGGSAGVVLVGPAGAGKTRLAREAVARWTGTGGAAEWVVGTPAAAIPFGALAHLLPAGPTRGRTVVALLAEISAYLARRARSGPLVVAVDDAHLLDDASAGLLHQMVVRTLVLPLLTCRSGEPACDAVRALCKDHLRRLSVRPLPLEAVDRLLDHALDGTVDPLSRHRLRRLADGNPLLLRDLVADARETKALVRRDGVWRWRGPVPAHARLGELVAARLGALEPAVRQVLEVVACGEPLAPALLSRLADPAAILAAEHTGLVVADTVGARTSLRLAHPLYGEVVRGRLPVTRARDIWRELAAALATSPCRRRDDVLTLGVWRLRSGGVDRPDAMLAAAGEALARLDLPLAERLVRAARGAGSGPAADLLLARILQQRGRYREASDALPALPGPHCDHQALWATTRASILYWGRGSADEAARTLDATTPPGQDVARATLSSILLFDGRCSAANTVARQVLVHPNPAGQATIWAATAGAAASGLLGRLDDALTIAALGRSVAVALARRVPSDRTQVEFGRCLALLAAGRANDVARIAEAGYRSALRYGARPTAGLWTALRGVAAKARGRPAEAQAALREAVALLDDNDAYRLVPVCLAEMAGAAALAADPATGNELIARADATRGPANRLFLPWIERNRAWVEAAGGALTRAAELAVRAAALAGDTEQPTIEALCLYDAARFGAARTVRARLARIAAELGGAFLAALAGAANALAGGDADALDRAADVFAGHGQRLLAAEAATAAAVRHGRGGVCARLAAERAAILTQNCAGARTLLLTAERLTTMLTPREREVALLAASLPSREIADRLGLSVRTVDNNLARAFIKLGVSGRSQLTRLLHDAPILSRGSGP